MKTWISATLKDGKLTVEVFASERSGIDELGEKERLASVDIPLARGTQMRHELEALLGCHRYLAVKRMKEMRERDGVCC